MEKTLKIFEYKGVKYEIKQIVQTDGAWFLKDFKNGQPFSPYRYAIREDININEVEARLGNTILDILLATVEEGIKIWVNNADKVKRD